MVAREAHPGSRGETAIYSSPSSTQAALNAQWAGHKEPASTGELRVFCGADKPENTSRVIISRCQAMRGNAVLSENAW